MPYHVWMDMPIERAAAAVGGQAKLAALLNVKAPTVNQWVKRVRPIPLDRCALIERVTNGAVRRWDLRPDDWHLIWPELVGTEGAPAIPQTTEEAAHAA